MRRGRWAPVVCKDIYESIPSAQCLSSLMKSCDYRHHMRIISHLMMCTVSFRHPQSPARNYECHPQPWNFVLPIVPLHVHAVYIALGSLSTFLHTYAVITRPSFPPGSPFQAQKRKRKKWTSTMGNQWANMYTIPATPTPTIPTAIVLAPSPPPLPRAIPTLDHFQKTWGRSAEIPIGQRS